MRGFLTFFVCAAVVAMASPTFWWIVQSHFSAAPTTYIEPNGAKREALLGPKAPWADWVVMPDGKLHVSSWFGAAPGYVEQGNGDVVMTEKTSTALPAIKQALADAGWTVETSRFDTLNPSLPPHPMTLCFVSARLPGTVRAATYSFQTKPDTDVVRVFWYNGEPAPAAMIGEAGGC